MANVVVFGTGDVARLVHFYLTHDSEHHVVAFTIDESHLTDAKFQGLPLVPYEKLEQYYPPDKYHLFVAISYFKLNRLRADRYLSAKARGYSFISYISSKAFHYGTPVGENCFILENNVIQPFASIGNNCLLLGANHLGHDCVIKDHCFLAADVSIGGGTIIGEYTFIGLNATIRNYVKIGAENIIGAGSLILADTDDQAVYAPVGTTKFEVPSNLIRI